MKVLTRAEKIAAIRAAGAAEPPAAPLPQLDYSRPNAALGKVLFDGMRAERAAGGVRHRFLDPIGSASVALYLAERKRARARYKAC